MRETEGCKMRAEFGNKTPPILHLIQKSNWDQGSEFKANHQITRGKH